MKTWWKILILLVILAAIIVPITLVSINGGGDSSTSSSSLGPNPPYRYSFAAKLLSTSKWQVVLTTPSGGSIGGTKYTGSYAVMYNPKLGASDQTVFNTASDALTYARSTYDATLKSYQSFTAAANTVYDANSFQ